MSELTIGMATYAVSLIGFGTASGLGILEERQGFGLIAAPNRIAASAGGVIDILLTVAVLFRLHVGAAVVVILLGAVGTGVGASFTPRVVRPGGVLLFFLIGVGALLAHFLMTDPGDASLANVNPL